MMIMIMTIMMVNDNEIVGLSRIWNAILECRWKSILLSIYQIGA